MKFTISLVPPAWPDKPRQTILSPSRRPSEQEPEMIKLAVPADAEETFAELWERIQERFDRNYSQRKGVSGTYFSKLQDMQGGDILTTDTIGHLFDEGRPHSELQLNLRLEWIDREASIEPGSALRPSNLRRRRLSDLDEEEQGRMKRARLELEERIALSCEQHEDLPSLSNQVSRKSEELGVPARQTNPALPAASDKKRITRRPWTNGEDEIISSGVRQGSAPQTIRQLLLSSFYDRSLESVKHRMKKASRQIPRQQRPMSLYLEKRQSIIRATPTPENHGIPDDQVSPNTVQWSQSDPGVIIPESPAPSRRTSPAVVITEPSQPIAMERGPLDDQNLFAEGSSGPSTALQVESPDEEESSLERPGERSRTPQMKIPNNQDPSVEREEQSTTPQKELHDQRDFFAGRTDEQRWIEARMRAEKHGRPECATDFFEEKKLEEAIVNAAYREQFDEVARLRDILLHRENERRRVTERNLSLHLNGQIAAPVKQNEPESADEEIVRVDEKLVDAEDEFFDFLDEEDVSKESGDSSDVSESELLDRERHFSEVQSEDDDAKPQLEQLQQSQQERRQQQPVKTSTSGLSHTGSGTRRRGPLHIPAVPKPSPPSPPRNLPKGFPYSLGDGESDDGSSDSESSEDDTK